MKSYKFQVGDRVVNIHNKYIGTISSVKHPDPSWPYRILWDNAEYARGGYVDSQLIHLLTALDKLDEIL